MNTISIHAGYHMGDSENAIRPVQRNTLHFYPMYPAAPDSQKLEFQKLEFTCLGL